MVGEADVNEGGGGRGSWGDKLYLRNGLEGCSCDELGCIINSKWGGGRRMGIGVNKIVM